MAIMKIRKRDGRIVDFDAGRIKDAIHKAFIAVELGNGEKAESVTREVVRRLEEKFTEQIPSVEDAQDLVINVLKARGYDKVALEYAAYRRTKEEIRALKGKLGILEPKLTVNAMEVLNRRYLLKDEAEKIVESPAEMFMRIAKAIAKVDRKYGDDWRQSQKIFYEMMTRLEFIPNSPTLFNAGTRLGQLSACFVLPVEDSLEGIFGAVKNMAIIEKSGGGVGFDFSKLRPKGDIVKSTKGVASGPVSFMRVFDTATEVIKAGGKRRGAMMGILRVDHPDILEFITSKQQSGFLSNFNISVAVTDKFMKAVADDAEYWLINPRNNEKTRKLKAKEVWNLIAHSAWASGDPGVIFIDEINRHNPTPQIGKIESTNPCITSDAWIMTEDGPRQVKELYGKKFTVIVNSEKWESSENGFFSTGTKPVYQLKTREGFELRLTKDHPVMKVKRITRYKMEREWVNAETLKIGDKIVLNNHRSLNGWKGKYGEREGYLIGLLLGDGTIKKDKVILSSWGAEKGSKAVRSLAFACAKTLPHRSDFNGWMRVKGRKEYRMSMGYFKKLAMELGLNPGMKTITKEMEQTSSEFCKGLLRGLFDADGSMQGRQSKGVSIRLAQSNLAILKAVQRILLRFGIFSKIYVNRRGEGISKMSNRKSGTKNYLHKPQHELVISRENMRYFYQKVGFGNSHKMEKLEKAIKSYKRKMNREHFIATVDEITQSASEEVYDVKIPGINAFDANGFYVHNCGEQPLLPYESCFAPETRIVSDREIETVEDLFNRQCRGEKILVATNLNGREKRIIFRPALVTKVGIRPTVRVTLANNQSLRATPDHKVFTEEGWKEAGKLTSLDKVMIQTSEAGDLIFDLLEEEVRLYQMFGWFTGGGWFTKTCGLTFGPQDTYAFEVLLPIWNRFTGTKNKVNVQRNFVRCVSCQRRDILEKFKSYGFIPARAPSKRVPKFILTAPKQAQIAYLQGLFSADGTKPIDKRRMRHKVELSSRSLELLREVQLVLLNLGIKSSVYFYNERKSGHSQGVLRINGIDYLKFVDLIGFPLAPYKQKRCCENTGRRLIRSKNFISVKSVEPIGETIVYDITEPVTHSLIAEGMIVHNCNLGSVNLSSMVEDGQFNWEKLRKVVRDAVHFLDNVIDANQYPLKEIATVTRANRKIGLGVMGFADMLIKLGIPYNSEEALSFGEKLMSFIEKEGRKKSVEIGEERGSFPNFDKSIWKDKYKAMRNATVTTIAPTGSISIIAGCSSGIEPIFAISFIRNVLGGTRLFETNPLFEIMTKERGFYSAELLEKIAKTGSVQKIDEVPDDVKRLFVTALDIAPEWHVRMQAAFQKYTDNAVSKTVNLSTDATVDDVRKIYDLAWSLKCKGVTVFRYGSKPEQVLYIGEIKAKEGKFVSAESEYAGGCPTKTCPFPS